MKNNKTMTSTVKMTFGDKVFYRCLDVFLVFILIVVVIPLWSTITLSFRPNTFIGTNLEGMFLAPWKWSTAAYEALLGNNGFLNAFINSIKILIGGVFTALILTIPMAYGLSVKTLPGRKILNVFVLIPYLFNVGIPEELKESARIDGAAEWYVLVRIILPLSKPILMTIGLYYGVSFWNDFFHAMLYLNDNSLQPLPILLRNILIASGMNEFVEVNAFGEAPIAAIKAASVFMSAIPMVIAYPFIQKYFTKGTLLGSVKG